ncbi:MAG: 50S ribosomal protein L10 [Nanoarchaeota archaeon]|nr:50S ribosomal protein L10 [Nanoarchaeota archaeon]
MKPKAKVAEYKKKIIDDFVKLSDEYPIIAAINMEGLPTATLQKMREQLRGRVVIRMTKRRLMKILFDKIKDKKPGIEQLTEHLKGMPALLFTKDNPFKLFKILDKNKTSAPAKGGQIAPKDVIVKAGPTPFAPGPIIGELGSFGIKSGVEGGKIAIKEDKVVVKEGEVINGKLAGILGRLGVQPMEIGMDLTAAYEDGTIYAKSILRIDEDEFMEKLMNSHRYAFNLAFEISYPTKDNIELMLQKAFKDSRGLALEQNILADAVVGQLLEKAERQMLSLKNTANIPVESKQEEKKEEPKPEVKEETKVEQKPVEEVKEEPKPKVKEETKVEQKPVEEVKEEPKPEVKEETKVEQKPVEEVKEEKATPEEIVKQTKEAFAKGELKKEPEEIKPSAEDILDEIKAKEPPKPEKVPSAHELMEKKKKEKK